MSAEKSTCWTLVQGAARGRDAEREEFAWRYAPLVEAYLRARWRAGLLEERVDDAVQEVFLECFRRGGALSRVDADRPGGFRAFLYGVCRNVALRVERRGARSREGQAPDSDLLARQEGDDEGASRAFDRAWAEQLMEEAARLQLEHARALGPDALERVRILELRFGEGLPVREIAAHVGVDPARVHREYAQAREEFKAALIEVVSYHLPAAGPKEVEAECERLREVLA